MAQKSRIIRLRLTFAMTLAAAMLLLMQSPSTMAVCGKGNGETGRPSIRTCSGNPTSDSTRRAHRLVRRAQDVDLVDLNVIDHADGPGEVGVADQLVVDLLAQIGRELFRILEFCVPEFLRKNHRGRHDRSGSDAAAGFVDPANASDSDGA